MKRRRKKNGLSGTPAEHTERQRRYLTRARSESSQAWRLIQRGSCGDATDNLRRANEAMGGYHAEVEWSGKGSQYGDEVRQDVRKTGFLFEERCVVPFQK